MNETSLAGNKGIKKRLARTTVAVALGIALIGAASVPAFAANSPRYSSYTVCKGWQIYYKIFLKKTITIPCWKPAPDKYWFNYK